MKREQTRRGGGERLRLHGPTPVTIRYANRRDHDRLVDIQPCAPLNHLLHRSRLLRCGPEELVWAECARRVRNNNSGYLEAPASQCLRTRSTTLLSTSAGPRRQYDIFIRRGEPWLMGQCLSNPNTLLVTKVRVRPELTQLAFDRWLEG